MGTKRCLDLDYPSLANGSTQVVQADPRSTYRKDKCAGEEYAFYIDHLDVGVKVVPIRDIMHQYPKKGFRV